MLLEERSRSVGQVTLLTIEQFLLVLEIAHLHDLPSKSRSAHTCPGGGGARVSRTVPGSVVATNAPRNDRYLSLQQL
jgi:hypothetical protein